MKKKELSLFLKETFNDDYKYCEIYELGSAYKKEFSIKENYKIIIRMNGMPFSFKKINKLKKFFASKDIEIRITIRDVGCQCCYYSDEDKFDVEFEINTNVVFEKTKINKTTYTYS